MYINHKYNVVDFTEVEIMRMEECEIIKKAVENGLLAPLQFDGKCEGFESDGREVPVSACEQCDLCTINN